MTTETAIKALDSGGQGWFTAIMQSQPLTLGEPPEAAHGISPRPGAIGEPLERIIRPIVEGQLRHFANEHPEVLEAVDWHKPRTDKRLTFVNSIAKRILGDLLCSETRVRLEQALVARPLLSPVDSVSGSITADAGGEVALITASPLSTIYAEEFFRQLSQIEFAQDVSFQTRQLAQFFRLPLSVTRGILGAASQKGLVERCPERSSKRSFWWRLVTRPCHHAIGVRNG